MTNWTMCPAVECRQIGSAWASHWDEGSGVRSSRKSRE